MATMRLMIDPWGIYTTEAFQDGAVEAAVRAMTDPCVDIDTWEFASSMAPYVWSLGLQHHHRTEFGFRVYYFLELVEPRQNSGVWL